MGVFSLILLPNLPSVHNWRLFIFKPKNAHFLFVVIELDPAAEYAYFIDLVPEF